MPANTRLPRKRHKSDGGDVFDGHFAVRLFRQALQYLHFVLRADRDDHAAADCEQVDQWLRHFVGCSRDDDCIEGCVLRPAGVTVTNPDRDVVVTLSLKISRRTLAEHVDDLDRVHLAGHFRQHRGLVTRAGTDFEHRLVRAQPGQVGHQCDDVRL